MNEGVSPVRGLKVFELTLRRILGIPLHPVLLLPGDVSRRVLDLVSLLILLLILIRAVVKLPVEFSTVEIQDELSQLAGYPHVLVLGEQIHVTERVDGNQGEIVLGLAEMVERMGELDTVRSQETDLTPLPQQLRLHQVVPLLDALSLVRVVEQNDEGKPLLRQLLGVLEGDLLHQWVTHLTGPGPQLLIVVEVPGEGLVLVVSPSLGWPVGHYVVLEGDLL